MEIVQAFNLLDIRVGIIIAVDDFPQARKPAYKLTINFGESLGIKYSSAQLTKNYTKETLIGKKVLGVVNLPPRQIGPFSSQVLTLGVPDKDNECILIGPDSQNAVIGGRLY